MSQIVVYKCRKDHTTPMTYSAILTKGQYWRGQQVKGQEPDTASLLDGAIQWASVRNLVHHLPPLVVLNVCCEALIHSVTGTTVSQMYSGSDNIIFHTLFVYIMFTPCIIMPYTVTQCLMTEYLFRANVNYAMFQYY